MQPGWNKRVRPRIRPTPGQMGALELKYAKNYLDAELQAGRIVKYRFEGIKLKLGPNTFYTPDFVVTKVEQIEFHEVKGFWEDDARVKTKLAAALFPEFCFVGVRLEKRPEDKEIRGAPKYWVFEEFPAC